MSEQERRSWRLALTGLAISALAAVAWAAAHEVTERPRVERIICEQHEEPTC